MRNINGFVGVGVLIVGGAFAFSGCEDESDEPLNLPKSSTTSTSSTGGSGGGGAGGGGAGAGASGGAGGVGGGSDIKTCGVPCGSAADCAVSAIPSADEDNWMCTADACIYLGCLNDAECGDGLVCRTQYGLPTCAVPCNAVADCAGRLPESAFACDDGACRLVGCASDAECDAEEAGTVCADAILGQEPSCAPGCSSEADCGDDNMATDSDNYICDGYCKYLGCLSDRECEADKGSNFKCL